jgi:2Fe-2S ferredoxin
LIKITYIEFNGREHVVDAAPGVSLMELAKKNNVPGIDADCGGACSCGTCHVYIDPAWQARVGGRNALEDATIEFASDVAPNSRLSCQMRITVNLDGLVVRLPASQR